MATARSRIQKGRAYQKKILERFKDTFGLDDDSCRTAIGAETGTDLKWSKAAQELVGLSVECKCVQKLNVWEALKQAQNNTPIGSTPALVFRRSVSGPGLNWICVPLEHYLKLRRKGE